MYQEGLLGGEQYCSLTFTVTVTCWNLSQGCGAKAAVSSYVGEVHTQRESVQIADVESDCNLAVMWREET